MLNKKKDFFILFVIIITSIYIGYENPKIVDIPKSIIKQPKLYYKFFLNKIGLGDDIFLRENKLSQSDLVLKNDSASLEYPMPLFSKGKDEVFVGRIRKDFSEKNSLNLWVVADNLRKGAATNAIQIAEYLIEKKILN